MEKMNPEVKKSWVDALRSGDYEQGRGGLRIDDDYCCLGVLCDLFAKAHQMDKNMQWMSAKNITESTGVMVIAGVRGILPQRVATWAGLKGRESRNPVFRGKNKNMNCSIANDSYGK